MKVVIVGGVAGGASAAARLRRLDERAEIVVYERGEHVSFANCGLPYHVGGVIPRRDALLLQTPHSLKARFNLDVRVRHEVVGIHPQARRITVRNLATGEILDDTYDALILSPGARPIIPPLPGVQDSRVHTLRSIADMDRIMAAVDAGATRAAVLGGGYIGVEMAENLAARGLQVSLVEQAPQVLTFLDPDMAAFAHHALRAHGVELRLGERAAELQPMDTGLRVVLANGTSLEVDLLVLAVGVTPETQLARDAGLKIGKTGGIVVDERMRTSDPFIFAVGDAVEVYHLVARNRTRIPLAGPANRQGRIAANVICGVDSRYGDTQGTGIIKVFDTVCAATGAPSFMLRALGIPFRTVTIHAESHASYYPDSHPVHLKLLYSTKDGTLLGAQACGKDGVDKRIDVLATAIRHNANVYDLEDYELAYAPPFGSAKDPVNLAAFVAVNDLRGLAPVVDVDGLDAELARGALVLDVRTDKERAKGAMGGAVGIPVDELRGRLGELPRDRTIVVCCAVGKRAHVAQRILLQNGFRALNLTGGYTSYAMAKAPTMASSL
ncbi:MAG: FAD-dependent oxidoreductase [Myxococcota bacterium]